MSKTSQQNTGIPTYALYDPDNGRILGSYAKYDAEKGGHVGCDPEEVIEAATGASPELSSGNFEVLEVMLEEGSELKDFKVDPKERKLVIRKPQRSAKK
ncbi:MAG: hypothetical protein ACYSWQ_05340 [Planctomycetota bacterium]|jgi:hypothetical protein